MKAYLSYSLNDEQKYVITVLAQVLREKGYVLSTGGGANLRFMPSSFQHSLVGSSLFIGVITQTGIDVQRVMNEYNTANTSGIPSLLLIDEEIAWQSKIYPSESIVLFNQHRPQEALELVRRQVRNARAEPIVQDNSAAWVLGGVAVLALIALLSDGKR